MRRLFVPTCLCLMAWSSAADFDLPLEKRPDSLRADNGAPMRPASLNANAAVSDFLPADRQNALAIADLPVEISPEIGDLPSDAEASVIDANHVPLPPVRRPVVERSRREVCDTLAKSARSNDLPVAFFIRLLFQESRFDPAVVSTAGAQGIAQFMPETAADEELANPFDPLQAIPASARLLRKLTAQFGNLGLAAAAYNAGPKRIQNWLAKKDKLPDETQGYVKTITGKPADTWRLASASGTALTVPHHAPCRETVPVLPTADPRGPRVIVAKAGRTSKSDKKAPAHNAHQKAPTKYLAARKYKNETHMRDRRASSARKPAQIAQK
jgi:Transglycosylase SLT domain